MNKFLYMHVVLFKTPGCFISYYCVFYYPYVWVVCVINNNIYFLSDPVVQESQNDKYTNYGNYMSAEHYQRAVHRLFTALTAHP